MRIVPYQKDYFASVKALWEEAFADDPPRNLAEIAIPAKEAEHPELFLIALDRGNVVGTVMAGYDGHRGWLYRVAVAKTCQGTGIGRQLIQEAEARLWKLGAVKINLQVRGSNKDVTAFYRRLGYRIEDRISLGKEAPLDLAKRS